MANFRGNKINKALYKGVLLKDKNAINKQNYSDFYIMDKNYDRAYKKDIYTLFKNYNLLDGLSKVVENETIKFKDKFENIIYEEKDGYYHFYSLIGFLFICNNASFYGGDANYEYKRRYPYTKFKEFVLNVINAIEPECKFPMVSGKFDKEKKVDYGEWSRVNTQKPKDRELFLRVYTTNFKVTIVSGGSCVWFDQKEEGTRSAIFYDFYFLYDDFKIIITPLNTKEETINKAFNIAWLFGRIESKYKIPRGLWFENNLNFNFTLLFPCKEDTKESILESLKNKLIAEALFNEARTQLSGEKRYTTLLDKIRRGVKTLKEEKADEILDEFKKIDDSKEDKGYKPKKRNPNKITNTTLNRHTPKPNTPKDPRGSADDFTSKKREFWDVANFLYMDYISGEIKLKPGAEFLKPFYSIQRTKDKYILKFLDVTFTYSHSEKITVTLTQVQGLDKKTIRQKIVYDAVTKDFLSSAFSWFCAKFMENRKTIEYLISEGKKDYPYKEGSSKEAQREKEAQIQSYEKRKDTTTRTQYNESRNYEKEVADSIANSSYLTFSVEKTDLRLKIEKGSFEIGDIEIGKLYIYNTNIRFRVISPTEIIFYHAIELDVILGIPITKETLESGKMIIAKEFLAFLNKEPLKDLILAKEPAFYNTFKGIKIDEKNKKEAYFYGGDIKWQSLCLSDSRRINW